ncbi:hypothetical protein C9374_000577 [Naegleria lovaniensis]|uniref:Uncharacterized protein n=1 Tax=Naegleria lovaniensis TaxID=51637 RepID=A0AA88GXY7_NAELO|nr:uncharacterized protein C9374_000577 [Naegleria lovaniensis]KAG2388413.1 hypothetical protein C9374_000577 [Naegleria lovaniensis]
MSSKASAATTTTPNHQPVSGQPPSISSLSSNTPFRTSIRELSSTGTPCSPRNYNNNNPQQPLTPKHQLVSFPASSTPTTPTSTQTHSNRTTLNSLAMTQTDQGNPHESSSSCSNWTVSKSNYYYYHHSSSEPPFILRANSSSALPRRNRKDHHTRTTESNHELYKDISTGSSSTTNGIPSSLLSQQRESISSTLSATSDASSTTTTGSGVGSGSGYGYGAVQDLDLHLSTTPPPPLCSLQTSMTEELSIHHRHPCHHHHYQHKSHHQHEKMFTFTPSPSKEIPSPLSSTLPPYKRKRSNLRCKTTDDIRNIYRANSLSPNLISHNKHSYAVRDKSRTLLWLNRDKYEMIHLNSPGSPIGNTTTTTNSGSNGSSNGTGGTGSVGGSGGGGGIQLLLQSPSFKLRASQGNHASGLKLMDHAATSVDLSSNGGMKSSSDSPTLDTSTNIHLLGLDDEEEDEEMKMERKKNIPTSFSDVTEELHYYIKNNLLDEFKSTLEKEKIDKENSGKTASFNVSAQYLDKDANNSSLLHKAASLNRFKFMSVLIDDYRASIEKKDIAGSTPLFYAVANNCIRACFYLLNKGCSVNIRDNFENTPLSVALRKGYMDVAKTLILFGADVNYKTQKGQTCLHMCCEEGDLSKVEFLLERGASFMRMNREDQHCLFQAAPHPHIIEYLCRYLLSIEEESVFNSPTPSPTCIVPVKGKNLEIEEQNKQDKQIFENMEDALSTTTSSRDATTKPTFSKLIVKMSGAGNTIIHHCASFGYLTSLKILVNYMNYETIVECLNTKDKKNGDTPLHVCVRKGHQDIALLLARAREVDVDAQNDSGDTALHIAITQQNQEIVTILVAANCSVNIKNNQKLTAKQLAKKNNMSLKVEEDKTLKSLKTQQALGFFQKMKIKFKKESNLTLEEKAAKRHTSAFTGSNTRLSTKDVRRISRGSSNMSKTVSQDEIEDMIKKQAYLKWTSKLEFDPEMNEYHKELFYQVNKLYYYWVADQHSIQIQICLSDLLEKTRKFFSKQDQYMQENHYSALAAHKQDHDMFLNKIESTLNKLNTLDFSLDEDLFSQISTTLLNHVLKHDMALSVFSKKKK